jgi:predicted O-methyltransferase YrrM
MKQIKRFLEILSNLENPCLPAVFIRLAKYFFVKGEITILEWELLFKLAKNIKTNCIVEIGTFKGKSAIALAMGAKGQGVSVYAVDPHEDYIENKVKKFTASSRTHFMKNMLIFNLSKQVRLVNLTSDQAVAGWDKKISLLFIDGNHQYAQVKKDFLNWQKFVVKNGILILHDATTKGLGPEKVLRQILKQGKYKKISQVDQMVVLQKIES